MQHREERDIFYSEKTTSLSINLICALDRAQDVLLREFLNFSIITTNKCARAVQISHFSSIDVIDNIENNHTIHNCFQWNLSVENAIFERLININN